MARTLVTLLVELDTEVPQAIQIAGDLAHEMRRQLQHRGADPSPRVVIARAERCYEGPAIIDDREPRTVGLG